MGYSTFDPKGTDTLKEPMFLGENLTIARYDQLKYPMLDKLTEKQLGFFWTPSEVDLSKDRIDFQKMPDHEKHIFVSNLQYQILLDSVQGRAPNLAFLPLVSIPELETFIEVWSAFETIHSRSYTHIIRNIFNDPSVVFGEIEKIEPIVKRAQSVTKHYDNLIKLANMWSLGGQPVPLHVIKKALYLTLVSVNVLEGIRFYVSFACSFSFAERTLMEGNAKIIKLIARDEAVHLSGTQFILNQIVKEDAEMRKIAESSVDEVRQIFKEAAEQEIEWAKYLMKDGSTLGLNTLILEEYVKHLTNARMKAIGLSPLFAETKNPILWVNNWLTSDNVQVAPQETEISSYLVGAIDNEVGDDDFDDFGEL